LQQQGKFISPEPKGLIRAANAPLEQLGEAAQHQIPHRMAPGIIDLLEAIEIQQHQHQTMWLAAVLLDGATDSFVKVGAVAKAGQVIESDQLIQFFQPQIEGQQQAEQLMVLHQYPLLATAQLERIVVQVEGGQRRVLDQHMGLATIEVETVDPDNSCRTIGKSCQQTAEIALPQQLLEQLVAFNAGQRREPLHLANPLLDAMAKAIK